MTVGGSSIGYRCDKTSLTLRGGKWHNFNGVTVENAVAVSAAKEYDSSVVTRPGSVTGISISRHLELSPFFIGIACTSVS